MAFHRLAAWRFASLCAMVVLKNIETKIKACKSMRALICGKPMTHFLAIRHVKKRKTLMQ